MTPKTLLITLFVYISLSFSSAFPGGMDHQSTGDIHAMSGQMHEMEAHQMGGHMGSMKNEEAKEYIRAVSPAGYDMVIGRENPLTELRPEVITEKGKEIKVFHMTVEDVKFEIFPGKMINGWGYNGQIPGPTIRVTEGDTIRIILKNNQKEEHTLHIHGLSKPMVMDGVPYLGQKPLKKGESYTYEFVVKNIGTSWYHCHVDSAHHVDMGMYGAFIVEPKEEKLEHDREYIMLLDEWPYRTYPYA